MVIATKCACVRARRASRSLTDLYDEALRPVGLKITQFSVLRTLERMGPVSISALAGEMALDRSTLGRNLRLLKRRSLVRLGEGTDLRARSVELTASARKLLAAAIPLWEKAQARVERKLGKEGVSALFELLAQVEQLR
jgi:DNA-binding MarR family transcriptional regulator